MIDKRITMLALLSLGGLIAAGPVAAQSAGDSGMTEQQMLKAFQKQKTRGLVIAPTSQPALSDQPPTAAMVTPEVLSPDDAPASATVKITPAAQSQSATAATPVLAAPSPAGATVKYEALPKDEQVNVSIRFNFDSAVLRADQKPRLTAVCHAMKAINVPMFRIIGHTDASGSKTYNDRLSRLRAEEVKRYLVSDCGLPSDRLQAVGVGEEHLLDPAHPRAEANRRVEFQVGS